MKNRKSIKIIRNLFDGHSHQAAALSAQLSRHYGFDILIDECQEALQRHQGNVAAAKSGLMRTIDTDLANDPEMFL